MSSTHAHSHHHHHHGHTHGHDFAGENQKHYDATAAEYDARPDVQELARRVCAAMLKAFPALFDEEQTVLMDYACGTGMRLIAARYKEVADSHFIARCGIKRTQPARQVDRRR